MTKIETTACNRRIHPAAAQDDLIDIDSLISDIDETWLFSIDEEHKQKKLDLWNLERSENSRKLLVYKLDSISRQLDGDHSKDLETRNTLNSHQRSPNLLHLSPIPPCSIVDTNILTHIPLSSDSSFHSPNIPVPLMIPEELPSPPGVCKDLVPQLASTPSRNVAPPRSDHMCSVPRLHL